MNKDVEKILEYVTEMENQYYGMVKGKDMTSVMLISAQASAFQRVRYFIEIMEENGDNT